jgi:ABC-2 type transport system permease protein
MLVAFPIMFLGGSYFSVSTLTGTLGALVKWLPLTALNDALRGLMTYRGHETAYGWSHDATVLAAWLIGSAVLAATTFRWSQAH